MVSRLYLPGWQLGVTPKPPGLSHPTARALKHIPTLIFDGNKSIQMVINEH